MIRDERNPVAAWIHFRTGSLMAATPAERDKCFLSREVIIPPINVSQSTMCWRYSLEFGTPVLNTLRATTSTAGITARRISVP